jgi:hypothetical protein
MLPSMQIRLHQSGLQHWNGKGEPSKIAVPEFFRIFCFNMEHG